MKSAPQYAFAPTAFAALSATAAAMAAAFDGEMPFAHASNRHTGSVPFLVPFSETVGANLQLGAERLHANGSTALADSLAGAEVDLQSLWLNRNDTMARTNRFDATPGGVIFDSATSRFDVDSDLGPSEIVDPVSVPPIPEATAATASGPGSLAGGLVCRHAASSARGPTS